MPNKLKKASKKNPSDKPKKAATNLKPEKEEKIDLKKLAKDERTWKITGAFFILIAIFLFISFISYFFTWKEDQSQVLNHSIFDTSVSAKNLLGTVGAFVSYFFIDKGFGIASFFICSFFFVVGINFLFSKKVFSVWRNLRYVVVGVLVVSVSLAFLFASNDFAFGGSVGTMISNWLITMIGTIGTAALLFVAFLAYVIWQFNPVFKLPRKSQTAEKMEEPGEQQEIIAAGKTVNDLYAEAKKGNSLKGDAKLFIATDESNGMPPANDLKIIEKDEEGCQ